MKTTSNYSRLLSLFFIAIIAVPVYWLARDKTNLSWSLIEYRYLEPFPPFPVQNVRTSAKRVLQRRPIEAWQILGTQFQSGLFPKRLETAASDRFPFRSTTMQLSYGFDRLMIRLGFAFLDDPAIPAAMRGPRIYETRQGISTLFDFPKTSIKYDIETMDETVSIYEALIQAYPEINFYVFPLESIDYSKVNPLNSYASAPVKGYYTDYFVSRIPEGLNLAMLRLTSFEDHLNFYFRTDHHWNIHGTLRAYEIIHTMLGENYPEISPLMPHDEIYTFPDIGFQGSLARFTSYQVNPPDQFEVVLVRFPPYRILDKNGKDLKLNKMDEYLKGNYSKKPFTDHYIEYYGTDDDYHEYVFENESDRNLLIIGDSYVNSIEMLLGSHYHHTYCVDVRNYPDEYFSLSDFLLEHEVDDILFLGGPSETIMHSWTISP